MFRPTYKNIIQTICKSIYENNAATFVVYLNFWYPKAIYTVVSMREQGSQQDFDKVSCGSAFSYLDYQSPLPLPKDVSLIPSHDEVNDSMSEIQQQFPHLPVDKVVSLLYKNLIQPKIPSEKAISVYSESQSVRQKDAKQSSAYGQKIKKMRMQERASKQQYQEVKFESMNNNPYNNHKYGKQKTGQVKKPPKGQNQQNLRKAYQWSKQGNKVFDYKMDIERMQSKCNATKDDEVKYHQKRLCAQAFCDRGYGLNKMKEVLQDLAMTMEIDKRRYKTVSSAFINQSYRRLQQFLINQCGRNIKPLTGPQMRALYAILLNSQTKFQDDEFMTFRKFVKLTYDLGSVSIFQQSAVKLYIKIQISLRGRIGAMKLDRHINSDFKPKKELLKSPGRFQNQRYERQSIWTAQMEVDLIDAIAQNRNVAKARDTLRQKYGQNVVLSNVKELKSRFFKILRISVKRLQRYAQEYAHKVPLLANISDQKIKIIIRSPDALDSRIALGRLYKTTSFNAQILTQVINVVNEFCYNDQTRAEINQVQKEPVINSVTDKIKHNINVSRRMLKNVTTPAQRASANGKEDLVFMKDTEDNYQHIVSLQLHDKLHYFRKTGILNNKGGYQYDQKSVQLRKLQMEDGDDDSSQLVMLSDED